MTDQLRFTKVVLGKRREPHQIPIARIAIRNHCLECRGDSTQETAQCTDPNCWLYPWRLGTTPPLLKSAGRTGNPELGKPKST